MILDNGDEEEYFARMRANVAFRELRRVFESSELRAVPKTP